MTRTEKDIKEKIVILLENSLLEPSSNYVRTKNKMQGLYTEKKVKIEKYIEEDPEDFDFINDQVNHLMKFYSQLTYKGKNIFKKTILKYTVPPEASFAGTAFNTLIHIKEFDKAFSAIARNLEREKPDRYLTVMETLSETLQYEWHIFTSKQINLIYTWLKKTLTIGGKGKLGKNLRNFHHLYKDMRFILSKIYRQINMIKTRKLKKEIITGYNPEINEDEKKLKEKITRYGFPKDLSETLEKIEQKLTTASDDFDFKGCMDLIRSFSERLYRTLIDSMDDKKGKEIDEKDSKSVAQFFIKKGLISEDQGKILTALRHFLSNWGSHRLKSRAEDARLSRNMTVEFSLYLLQRLEGHKIK